MNKHTPIPWEVEYAGKAAYIRMFTGKIGLPNETGHAVFSVQPYHDPKTATANAAFIVKAVNNHDKLFEALQETYRAYGIEMQPEFRSMIKATLEAVK